MYEWLKNIGVNLFHYFVNKVLTTDLDKKNG